MTKHLSVLKKELLEVLNITKEDIVVDCTLGGGGHAVEVLTQLENAGGGIFIGIDVDDKAIKAFKVLTKDFKNIEIKLINGNFSKLDEILEDLKIKKVNKIYADLGFSSDQIDEITFRKDQELDLRMDKSLMVKAKDLLNGLYKGEIEKLLREYGDVKFAGVLAREIELYKRTKLFDRTSQLNAVVKTVLNNVGKMHLIDKELQKIYQALRVAVNSEFVNLERMLETAVKIVDEKGIIALISFHSGEDRIVKRKLKTGIKNKEYKWVHELIIPTSLEISINPKSRSAKLRAVKKV